VRGGESVARFRDRYNVVHRIASHFTARRSAPPAALLSNHLFLRAISGFCQLPSRRPSRDRKCIENAREKGERERGRFICSASLFEIPRERERERERERRTIMLAPFLSNHIRLNDSRAHRCVQFQFLHLRGDTNFFIIRIHRLSLYGTASVSNVLKRIKIEIHGPVLRILLSRIDSLPICLRRMLFWRSFGDGRELQSLRDASSCACGNLVHNIPLHVHVHARAYALGRENYAGRTQILSRCNNVSRTTSRVGGNYAELTRSSLVSWHYLFRILELAAPHPAERESPPHPPSPRPPTPVACCSTHACASLPPGFAQNAREPT